MKNLQQQYKEKTKHGSLLMPLARYTTNIGDLLPFYPIHWHEEVEIIKVTEGSGVLCIGGIRHNINMGDIVVIPPFVLHSIHRHDQDNMTIQTVVFNLRLIDSGSSDNCTLKYFAPMLNSSSTNPCIINSTSKAYEGINASLTTIFLADDQHKGYDLEVKANLYWVFYHLYNNDLLDSNIDQADSKTMYTLKTLLQYIKTNYMNSITIAELAQLCGYSQYYLMKLFKTLTGNTVVDYINKLRLNIAGEQILTTKDDISSIAYSVGYNNISYFNRQFVSQYHMTPTQWRKQYIIV